MDRLIPLNSRTRAELSRQITKLLPLAVILLAAILRFHLLGNQSLWNDEGNTLRLIERPILTLLENASHDIHPPGYYLALKAWWLFTGESDFALRAFSAFAGVLTVACVYALGRALFSPGAGLAASVLVAVNGFSVYYAQEARMYALLALLAAASMLVFVRWTARPTWRLAIALALLNAAGLYTQYTYPAVMVTQGILFVLWLINALPRDPFTTPLPSGTPSRGSGGEVKSRAFNLFLMYLALNLLTLILFIPQLSTALAQITTWPRTGHDVDAVSGLATVLRWLVYGNTSNNLPWFAFLWPILFAVAAFLPDWMGRSQPGWWRKLLPLLWLLIIVMPLFALGLFRDANLKFLLPAQIASALLIGRGAWLLWEIGSPNMFILTEALPRLLAIAGSLSILMFSSDGLNNLYNSPAYARSDYRAMAQAINADPRPGDAIILDAPNQWEVFTYYYHGTAPIYPLPEGLGGDDAKTTAQLTKALDSSRRIFVLYWGESERDPNRVVEKILTERAFESASTWYGDVRFVQYATLPGSTAVDTGATGTFGDSIHLQKATLSARDLRPGEVLGVTLTWTTDQKLSARYKVFIHLLNAEGKLVAQRDSEPGNNLAPTTIWEPGKPLTDSHGLLLPISLPAGDYTLIMGLYDINDPVKRLSVGKTDHVELGTIHVSR